MVRKTHDESLQDEKKSIVYNYVNVDYISKTQDLADVIFGRFYTKIKLSTKNQFTITAFYKGEYNSKIVIYFEEQDMRSKEISQKATVHVTLD